MLDLGLEVLLKGQNMARLFTGLLAALKISLVSVAVSLPAGILLGTLMTWKNPFIKAALRDRLSGYHPHHASDGAVVPCVFWDDTGVWMGFVRGKCFGYRIFPLGNCRDERSGKRGARQHTGPSV